MDFRIEAELHWLREHIERLQTVAMLMESGDLEGARDVIEDQTFGALECRDTLEIVLGWQDDDDAQRDSDYYWRPVEGGGLYWTGKGNLTEFRPEGWLHKRTPK